MEAAIEHCTKGIGTWDWASNAQRAAADVVMASAGDSPTQEALAVTVMQVRLERERQYQYAD
jgi:xylulose-5-phosphate/fructose-6-phosphate phosphoketolase